MNRPMCKIQSLLHRYTLSILPIFHRHEAWLACKNVLKIMTFIKNQQFKIQAQTLIVSMTSGDPAPFLGMAVMATVTVLPGGTLSMVTG